MRVPLRVEKFIETIISRLEAIKEALRDQVSSEEHTHTASQQTREEIRWQRLRRRIEERRIKKRADRESKADAQKNFNKTHRQQVILNLLTLLAFLSAVAYAGIAVRQWQEMIRSSEAAEASAITADKSLNENAYQFRKSLEVLQAQTEVAQRNAQTAQRQLEIIQSQFNIAQRPWLSTSIEITNFTWTGPRLEFAYKITAENFGNLPASLVYLIPDNNDTPTFTARTPDESFEFVMKDLRNFCNTSSSPRDFVVRMRQQGRNPATIFPHQKYDKFPEVPSQHMPDKNRAVIFFPRGCVAYYSPSDGKLHQTGFMFWPVPKDPTRLLSPGISKDDIKLIDYSGEAKSD
jgi:hypothetical protein